MANHDVLPLQKILQTQGYAITTLDGVFGPETRAAMQKYETEHKLTQSDQPTHELCDSLGIDLGADFPYQPISALKVSPMASILLSFLNSSVALGIIRNILMALGAVIVTKGWADQNTVTEIVGAAISGISAILSAISNNNKATDKAIVKAVEAHPAITVVPATATATGKPIVAVVGNTGGLTGFGQGAVGVNAGS